MIRKKVFVHLESGRGYSRDLLRGIYDYNNQVSQWQIIFEPAWFLKTQPARNDLSIIRAVKPDGCILEFGDNIPELRELGIPIIQVTSVNHFEDIPYVKGNYDTDGALAASYFSNKGFKNLAFFGIEKLEWSVARLKSFQKLAQQAGAQFYSYLLKGNESDILTHNFGELIQWLQSLPRPTGVLCCNDDFGQILINACSMAEIKVPYEIAVLGIDNDELICNITYPNLSSISRNHHQTAAIICSTLGDMMNGAEPREKVILTEAAEVAERSSTDTIAAADEEVARAISFISRNTDRPINPADVIAETSLSAKTLNNRFRTVTGHSIHDEIQHRKLIRFKQLLRNNMSIKEIAFALGFPDHSHVSRWFSNLEGISPVEWKKKFSPAFSSGNHHMGTKTQ